MIANLTWTPPASNSAGQEVQYRLKGSSTWILYATVAASVNNSAIPGLLDNEVYEFRIVNNCTVGGPTPSLLMEGVKITCPTVTLTQTYNSVTYSFPENGGDVDFYDIELLNGSGTSVIATQTKAAAATITGTFNNLNPATQYNVRVKPKIGTSYVKADCNLGAFSTPAQPACPAPTNVIAVIN